MAKSGCGGVRSSKLDSLAMRYYNKKRRKNHRKQFFSWKISDVFQKNLNFQIVMFFIFFENQLLWKKLLFEKFQFFEKNRRIFFQEKNVFSWKFSVFLFLWYLIPKLSNVELLTPPHTLLVTVYASCIFSKIRKIKKIHQTHN